MRSGKGDEMRLIDADALIDTLGVSDEEIDFKEMLREAPTIEIPHADDWEAYSERLWKNAYERGKADRPSGEWIPCSERLPRPYTGVLVCDECGWISLGSYRPCDVTEKDSGWSTFTRIKIPTDGIIAWMPLPKPWKGADDE